MPERSRIDHKATNRRDGKAVAVKRDTYESLDAAMAEWLRRKLNGIVPCRCELLYELKSAEEAVASLMVVLKPMMDAVAEDIVIERRQRWVCEGVRRSAKALFTPPGNPY